MVDAWQLASWEDYRDVQRLGRKTRLAEKQRELLWSIFSRVRSALGEQGRLTEPAIFVRVAAKMAEAAHPPFDSRREVTGRGASDKIDPRPQNRRRREP